MKMFSISPRNPSLNLPIMVNWWTGRDSDPRPSGDLVKNLQTGRSSAQLKRGIPG
jgi:hypothetical protein